MAVGVTCSVCGEPYEASAGGGEGVCPTCGAVEVPAPTAWPLVLGLGIALVLGGVATSLAFSLVGLLLLALGLGGWVAQLLPGRGRAHENPAAPDRVPPEVVARPGTVEQLGRGMPGYRLRLPQRVHPISAGVRGGIVGGLLMPVPALAYGLLSGHGLWYPVNLLAGMMLPGVDRMAVAELEQFSATLLLLGVVVHAVISLVVGLLYGVLLPTLPPIPGGQVVWGGLVMPLLWTGVGHSLMGVVNPLLQEKVSWPWFVLSQVVYGLAAAVVVIRSEKIYLPPVGSGPEAPVPGGQS